ncbi:hypothetical protein ACFSSF_12455 [Dietzia aerolata]|uniref:hypothetical protein n=1 Tax=Dietzia aerolata TaxID=595984 RepID=UPI00363735C4
MTGSTVPFSGQLMVEVVCVTGSSGTTMASRIPMSPLTAAITPQRGPFVGLSGASRTSLAVDGMATTL